MERTLKPWEASSSSAESKQVGKGKNLSPPCNELSVNALHNKLLQSVAIPGSKRNRQRDVYGGAPRSPSPSTSSHNSQRSIGSQRASSTSSPSRPIDSASSTSVRSPGSPYRLHNSTSLPVAGVSKEPTSSSAVIPPNISLNVDHNDGRITPPPSYEEIEPNALLFRIDRDTGGAIYEDLPLVEEINQPAPSQRRNLGTTEQPFNVSIASVELLHRRTTKDGRSKLKLGLAGLRVDTCGICLAQFKPKERGAITDCNHCFHERCLQKWLARSSSCPACRQSLRNADTI